MGSSSFYLIEIKMQNQMSSLILDAVNKHPLALLLLSASVAYIVYYRYLHPLARYPGPFWASLTNLWCTRLSIRGDWPQTLQELHNLYGPVIRIAPNEVSIDSPEAVPKIYGIGKGFVKTGFYTMFGDPK